MLVLMREKNQSCCTSDDDSNAGTTPCLLVPNAAPSFSSILVLIHEDKRLGEGRGAIH
jgi:hypothetical protein